MNWVLLIPILLGLGAVIQGGLNRQIADSWGLSGAVMLNNLVFLVACIVLFAATKLWPQEMPELFRDKGSFTKFQWWYWLPGIFGFALVVGIPFVIAKVGALKMFLGLIAAQLIGGLIWDALVERIGIDPQRVIGCLLAFAGVILVFYKK